MEKKLHVNRRMDPEFIRKDRNSNRDIQSNHMLGGFSTKNWQTNLKTTEEKKIRDSEFLFWFVKRTVQIIICVANKMIRIVYLDFMSL